MGNPFDIIEKHVIGRSGLLTDCEDAIFISDKIVSVIDGSSSKTDRRWDGLTGGKTAASLLIKGLSSLSPGPGYREAVNFLTKSIADFYQNKDSYDYLSQNPQERCSASIVIFNSLQREIWMIGDCQFIVDGFIFQNPIKTDKVLSEMRALYLNVELLRGKTVNDLVLNDTGKKYIDPLLKSQWLFQNSVIRNSYTYGVIDGFFVPDALIRVYKVAEDFNYITLASDGYPFLKQNLEESEYALQDFLKNDPLGIDVYKTLRCKKSTEVSFDDRAFIKIQNRKGLKIK